MKKSAVAERAGKELKFKLSAHCLVRVGWLRGGLGCWFSRLGGGHFSGEPAAGEVGKNNRKYTHR